MGWLTLFKQLETIMSTKKTDREIGDLFQPLKANVLETVKAQHAWQSTALKRLVRVRLGVCVTRVTGLCN